MLKTEYYKEFTTKFNALSPHLTAWQKWEYLISAMACSLANAADRDSKRWKKREAEYKNDMAQLGITVEEAADMLGIVIRALEDYPQEDFLGDMYMRLRLSDHWKGQFFTPTNVAEMMAKFDLSGDTPARIENSPRKYISIADPSCGAGVTLLAAAKTLREQGINYQQSCFFVGQDIDRVAAQMCFIQLALIGAPGYVIVGDTLVNPGTAIEGNPLLPVMKEGQDYYFTPMYWTEKWQAKIIMSKHAILAERIEEQNKGDANKIAS